MAKDSVKGLDKLLQEKNIVLVKRDESCEMAEIAINGHDYYRGNYWDFHPGCVGGLLPESFDWHGVNSFANAIVQYIQSKGKQATIKNAKYTYED